MRHILKSQQFDRPFLEELFRRAEAFRDAFEHRRASVQPTLGSSHQGKMLFNVFYEPSTRTRFSFSAAAKRLGMEVIETENAREFSSAAKGETLEDTIRVLCEYEPDVVVLRHYETGSAERAAAVSSVPIINAGDGRGQHPTQSLLDLYTIWRAHGRIDGLTVAIGGDLANGRTARSLAYLLAKFKDVRIVFVAPTALRIGADIRQHLAEKGVAVAEANSVSAALPHADAVYWTRLQWERLPWWRRPWYRWLARRYAIGLMQVKELMKPQAILMHPLPRLTEIERSVDTDPRAVYISPQVGNGMFIRMGILDWVLGE